VSSPPATLADFRYRTRFDPESRAVRFLGPGGHYDAVLLKGALQGTVGLAFNLLGKPSGMLARVRRSMWTVTAPKRSKYPPGIPSKQGKDGLYATTGEARRIVIIEGPEVVVLRFNRRFPRSLEYALRCLFTGQEYPLMFALDDAPRVHSSGKEDDETTEQEVSDGTGQEGGEQDQPAPAVGVQQ